MVVISATKRMQLHSLELVIRRCPVCLKDTEQDAFYTPKPDFAVEALTPTTPQFAVNVLPKEEHKMNWYIVSRCRECGYLYKVTGIPQYKIKDLSSPKEEVVNFAILCCDICYNEDSKYEPADIFINLTGGKHVHLCDKHAAEVDAERTKTKSYAFLINRFNVWKINDAMPKAVQLEDERVIVLKGDRGPMEQVLMELNKSGELLQQDLIKRITAASLIHKTSELIELQILELEKLSLVSRRSTGSILKKRYISLTDEGKRVATALVKESLD